MEIYERTFKNFLEVRDALFEEMAQCPYCLAAQAYRKCYGVPLIFYKDKSKIDSIEQLKSMCLNNVEDI